VAAVVVVPLEVVGRSKSCDRRGSGGTRVSSGINRTRVRVSSSNSCKSNVTYSSGSGSIRSSINIGEVLIVTSEVAAIKILVVVMVVVGVQHNKQTKKKA
jgi:hypothetical protein